MTALSKISPGDIPTFANGVLGFVAMILIQDLQYLAASTFLFLAMAMDGLNKLGHRFAILAAEVLQYLAYPPHVFQPSQPACQLGRIA